jgi:hypothetical protein
MAHLSLTCSECGSCGKLIHSRQDFDEQRTGCSLEISKLAIEFFLSCFSFFQVSGVIQE